MGLLLNKKNASQDKRGPLLALAGNPNVGKSTVFNELTGMNQHTGWFNKGPKGMRFGDTLYSSYKKRH